MMLVVHQMHRHFAIRQADASVCHPITPGRQHATSQHVANVQSLHAPSCTVFQLLPAGSNALCAQLCEMCFLQLCKWPRQCHQLGWPLLPDKLRCGSHHLIALQLRCCHYSYSIVVVLVTGGCLHFCLKQMLQGTVHGQLGGGSFLG